MFPATVANGYVHMWVPSFPTKFPSVTSTCGAGAFGRNVSSVKAANHKQPRTLFSTFFCVWGRSFPMKQILGNVSHSQLAMPNVSVYMGPALTLRLFLMKYSSPIRRKTFLSKFLINFGRKIQYFL